MDDLGTGVGWEQGLEAKFFESDVVRRSDGGNCGEETHLTNGRAQVEGDERVGAARELWAL